MPRVQGSYHQGRSAYQKICIGSRTIILKVLCKLPRNVFCEVDSTFRLGARAAIFTRRTEGHNVECVVATAAALLRQQELQLREWLSTKKPWLCLEWESDGTPQEAIIMDPSTQMRLFYQSIPQAARALRRLGFFSNC